MIVVVDASVAAMWFLPEPFSERAAALLETGHELVAARLIRLEVASALLKAVRRGTLEAADAGEAIRRLNSPLKKASLTGFHATAKHIAAKAVSPSSETMRTI